jgi:hypothetical protein
MFGQDWMRSAALFAALLTTMASAANAADAPAAPAPAAPTAVVTTPTLASVMQPSTIDVSPAIRSVVPGGALADRPRIALVTTGRDAELVGTLQRTLEQLGASVMLVPLAAGEGVPNIAAASLTKPAAPAGAAAAISPIAWEGQLRYRYESRIQLDYRLPGTLGRAATQSLGDRGDVAIMRTRVGATLKVAPGVRGYFNLQDARTMGAEGSPSGTLANVDLYNAWLDLDSLGTHPLFLRVGRQVLTYGEGRVVSGADWGNAGRGYDGARMRWAPGHSQVDGFVTWLNEGRITGQDRLLSGLDALWRGRNGLEAEVYQFRRDFGDAGWTSELGRKGGIHDATSGLRTRAPRGAFELRAEGAVQRGKRAGDPVRAWFGVGRVTADLKSAWKTRLYLEHGQSSGDANPTDALFQRFDPVYWAGHSFQGTLDIVGESNVSDWCGGVTAQPVKGWTVQSEFNTFSLSQARDYWVDDAGTMLRRSVAGAAGKSLGRELDATVRWDTRSKVAVLVGASRFWRGEYVRNSGGGSDVSWGFAQLNVTF